MNNDVTHHIQKVINKSINNTLNVGFYEHLYRKFKRSLKKETCLFLLGSTAYISLYNNMPQTLSLDMPVCIDKQSARYNVSLHTPYSITVQKSGIYQLSFLAQSDCPNSFVLFVNGMPCPLMPSNQFNTILHLKHNDILSFRSVVNYNNVCTVNCSLLLVSVSHSSSHQSHHTNQHHKHYSSSSSDSSSSSSSDSDDDSDCSSSSESDKSYSTSSSHSCSP